MTTKNNTHNTHSIQIDPKWVGLVIDNLEQLPHSLTESTRNQVDLIAKLHDEPHNSASKSSTSSVTFDKKTLSFLITPWAKTYKKEGPCSKRDWEEQMERKTRHDQMMWDDSKKNKSKVGDILICWRYMKEVTFHWITDVKDPSQRLPTWSKNVGQHDRQVLFISEEFKKMDWVEWINLGGHKRCMGTGSVTKCKDKLLDILI